MSDIITAFITVLAIIMAFVVMRVAGLATLHAVLIGAFIAALILVTSIVLSSGSRPVGRPPPNH